MAERNLLGDLTQDLHYPPEYRKLLMDLSFSDGKELKDLTADWINFDRNIKIFARSVVSQKDLDKRRKIARRTYDDALKIKDMDLKYGEVIRSVVWNLDDNTLERVIQVLDL